MAHETFGRLNDGSPKKSVAEQRVEADEQSLPPACSPLNPVFDGSRCGVMVTASLEPESDVSRNCRRLVRLVAFAIIFIGFILGIQRQSITQPVISCLIAYGFALLSLIVHLNLGELSVQERKAWTARLSASGGVVLALITYFSDRDLHMATLDLDKSGGEAQ